MGSEEGPIEFLRYARPLKLHAATYSMNPQNMEHLETAVTEIRAAFKTPNRCYGRGFVQIIAGNMVKRETIYRSSQFHMGLIRHMLGDDVVGTHVDTKTGGWSYLHVLITVCREYCCTKSKEADDDEGTYTVKPVQQ